jgi:versiconal hemiacetal acetate reductase
LNIHQQLQLPIAELNLLILRSTLLQHGINNEIRKVRDTADFVPNLTVSRSPQLTDDICNRVGDSGLKVSQVILGCMSYGDPNWQPWVTKEEDALPILKHAYDSGINTFDVADTYSNGKSEEIIGRFLKEYNIPRQNVVILTKCYHYVDETRGPIDAVNFASNDGPRVNKVGLSRKHIFDAVERSVQRLGTYIDVLQIHRLDRDVPMKEIMKALNDVVESGKARYIGASSVRLCHFVL